MCVAASVEGHAFQARETCLNFPEIGQRTPIWLTSIEAALQVPEPQLNELLAGFMANEICRVRW